MFVLLVIVCIVGASASCYPDKNKVILHGLDSEEDYERAGVHIVDLNNRLSLIIVDRYAAGQTKHPYYSRQALQETSGKFCKFESIKIIQM